MRIIHLMKISVVIPAYNEEEKLEDCCEEVIQRKTVGEVLIVEDGCTDSTPKIASRIASENDKVRHIHKEEKLGKGRAIEIGFENTSSDIVCFMDADLSTDLSALERLLEEFEDGADLVIGSRYMKESRCERKAVRSGLSRIYNILASKMLGNSIKDRQCGFKALRKSSFEELNDSIQSNGWFWDTELIYRANQSGMIVREISVDWRPSGESEVNIGSASLEMLRGLIGLKEEQHPRLAKYVRFASVGAVAGVLNSVILFTLTEFLNLHYLASSAIAIETGIIFMFFINNHFTFETTKKGLENVVEGIIRSNLVRSAGIGLYFITLYALTEAGSYYLISNVIALFISSILNFIGEKRFNWKE
ncbi:MAG: DUF853 family protein [Nanohaloarchaea archaeon]|nr:DUF853 family protein [Candidatus Nanohaloarchaea archaeon]